MKKAPIVLIHGLRGDRHGLLEIAHSLEGMGYYCVVPDLPGSGDRAELDDKTLQGYAHWLHDFIGEQNFECKPVILGHSMGSIIASHYIDKFPDDVNEKLILLSPIFRGEAGQLISDINYALMSTLLHLFPHKVRQKLMRSKPLSFCISHFLTIDKTQQARIDELHYRYSGRFSSDDSLLADAKISMREQSIFPYQKKVLICIGDHDRLTSPALAKKRSQKNATSEFKLVAGSGHLVNYERPSLVAKLIDKYLQQA